MGHQAGAGRHRGRLGALLVRLPNGTDFAIGTGFSDRERENPPAVGSTVTFRYQELSEAGVPRFPSWVGVRIDAAPIVASASATSAISCAPAVPAPEAGASVITTSAGSSPKARKRVVAALLRIRGGRIQQVLGSYPNGKRDDHAMGPERLGWPVQDEELPG